mgnify:CR=1 FL=1
MWDVERKAKELEEGIDTQAAKVGIDIKTKPNKDTAWNLKSTNL